MIDTDRLVVDVPTKHVSTRTTALCEGQQDTGSFDSVKPPLVCQDALLTGTRVAQLLLGAKPERMYLERPDCDQCSGDDLRTGTLHVWAAGQHLDIAIDSRSTVITVLDPGDGDHWPMAGDSSTPPLGRPTLPDAPAWLQERSTLPLCGVFEAQPGPAARRCFRDAVVSLRPAELVHRYSTGEGLFVDRFEGSGAPTRYSSVDGAWIQQRGALLLYGNGTAQYVPLE